MRKNAKHTYWGGMLLSCIGFALFAGCAQDQSSEHASISGGKTVPEGMLAIVGNDTVDARDLRDFEAKIQTVHQSPKTGVEKHRDHLLSLIDVKLMVREAEARGLHRSSELDKDLKRIEHNAMLESYLHVTVGQDIRITEDELRENFNSHPARFAVKGAHIRVATRERADSLYAVIQSGQRSFESLAKAYSLDEKTAADGGVFPTYYAYDRVSDKVYAKVFSMEVGQVSEPFRAGLGWELGKVVDRILVPYEKYRTVIQRATMMKKFNRLKKEHIDSLQYKLHLRVQAEPLRAFIEAWNRSPGTPDLTPEQFAEPLYVYDGGSISAEQTMYLLSNTRLGESTVDSVLVDQRIRDKGAPDMLLAEIARRAGFHENSEVVEKVKKERERWLLQALWDKVLEVNLEVGDEDIRAHYDAHPESYKIPEEIIVQEIMVADSTRAEELLKDIERGADMGDLATRYSIRRFSDENGGLYAMRAFERMVYQELMDAAINAPVEKLLGPIEIDKPLASVLREPAQLKKAYSIFKVLERLPERVQTFELSKEKAVFYARQKKQQERVVQLNEELRRKYKDEWGIGEESIGRYTRVSQVP